MGNPFENEPPAYDGPGPSQGSEKQGFQSQVVPSGSTFKTKMASITFYEEDRVQFYRFPEEVVTIMHSVFTETWKDGVKDVRDYEMAREIRFKGIPFQWDHEHNKETRAMLLKMVSTLYDLGWMVHCAADFNEKSTSRNTLIFHYRTPPPPPCNWLTVNVVDWNYLRVAPLPHPDLVSALVETFGENVKKKFVTEADLIFKFDMPIFQSDSTNAALLNDQMLSMLETFERFGYTIYTNFNDILRRNHPIDLFIMQQQKNWAPGKPVFHM